MPSNNVLVNYLEAYEVHDEDMPQLIEWLEKNSHKIRTCPGNLPNTIVDETNKPGVT